LTSETIQAFFACHSRQPRSAIRGGEGLAGNPGVPDADGRDCGFPIDRFAAVGV